MVIAGNVAGCANLAATADIALLKPAIRDGVVDFVVTSLDEALRILKNEIRKREAVAVCVSDAPAAVEREMQERGVLPDFVFAGPRAIARDVPLFGSGSRKIQASMPDARLAILQWKIAESVPRWMPKLDAIAADSLASDAVARRWIRLSPRYCGRGAQGQRALYIDPRTARKIVNQFGDAVRDGDVGTEVAVALAIDGETIVSHLKPRRID
jgi:urocanate hydratase